MGDAEISVAVTPDGLGDAIKEHKGKEYFVKPMEHKMSFGAFVDALEKRQGDVHYAQHQNGSFNKEFERLWSDIDHASVDFAREAFGEQEDAVNLWMGDDRAVSSMHKDPYENIYCVVRGRKRFTLLPPIDTPFLYQRDYVAATYERDEQSGELRIAVDVPEMTVPWIPVDPVDQSKNGAYPMSERCHVLDVVVEAGEILYLPSLYYHRVAQQGDSQGKTIAINYWFDMKYGLNYVYYQFLSQFKAATIDPSSVVVQPTTN
eukprot:gene15875-18867_t